MRQHTKGMVGSTNTWVLLEIYFFFGSERVFKHPLKTGKVIAMSLVYYFIEDTV